MSTGFDAAAAARHIADAHEKRETYKNLSGALEPKDFADAYSVQEALRPIWEPKWGPVAGLKIAVTTKVMQELMGISHPCGGTIYSNRVHSSPHELRLSQYMHVVLECELAVRVKRTLGKKASPWTREEVRAEISEVMPAFELIEDRNAVYKETKALTLIADNAWNAGIVLGKPIAAPAGMELNGLKGRLVTPGGVKEGLTDDPMGALAWIANLAVERDRPLIAGQVVITGSVVPTLPIAPGQRFQFSLEGIGEIAIEARG